LCSFIIKYIVYLEMLFLTVLGKLGDKNKKARGYVKK
jgi:hypothetical protein